MPNKVIAICPETCIKHANALYVQKVKIFNVKSRGSKRNHGALKDDVTDFPQCWVTCFACHVNRNKHISNNLL
jgi:hypothetical protein